MSVPRNTSRKLFKRELQRTIGNLDWALEHIGRFVVAYAEHHPDLAAQAAGIGEGMILLKDAIKKLDEQV